jgi:hypothetical protein
MMTQVRICPAQRRIVYGCITGLLIYAVIEARVMFSLGIEGN